VHDLAGPERDPPVTGAPVQLRRLVGHAEAHEVGAPVAGRVTGGDQWTERVPAAADLHAGRERAVVLAQVEPEDAVLVTGDEIAGGAARDVDDGRDVVGDPQPVPIFLPGRNGFVALPVPG
jgi:hypothetical protein